MASRQLSSHIMMRLSCLSTPSSSLTRTAETARTARCYSSAATVFQTTRRRNLNLLQNSRQSRALHAPYKDSQERESLKPRKSEGTMTGSDDEVAGMPESWNSGQTRPEEELQESRREGGWSMLDESGGNQEFSKPQGDSPSENKPGEKTGKKSKSGGAKTKKHGELKPKA